MRRFAARESAARKRSRSTGGPVLSAFAVLGVYAVIVGAAGGSLGHVMARAGRDRPLLALALAGVLVHSLLAPRAQRRWRSGLATALGALATGVSLAAAIGGGDHTLAELEAAVGVPLPTVPGLPAAYAALVAVGLLVAACVSVHGATMLSSGRRSRVPASAGVYPVQALPGFFRFLHSWLPLRYLSDGVRAVTFGGGPPGTIARAAGVLVGYAVLGALAALAAARHTSRRLAREDAGGPQDRSVADPDAAMSAGMGG